MEIALDDPNDVPLVQLLKKLPHLPQELAAEIAAMWATDPIGLILDLGTIGKGRGAARMGGVRELPPGLREHMRALESRWPEQMRDIRSSGQITAMAGRSAAEALPPMKGMGAAERQKVLTAAGFRRVNVSNSAGKNEKWRHPDGSEVRVHPYGNEATTPYPSANNAHIHKQDAAGNQLNDRGFVSPDPNATHIGVPNPRDLPSVRGRPHGAP